MKRPLHRPPPAQDSMTPLVDVVFLLLVFFVVAAAGQKPEAVLPTELSGPGVEAPAEQPQIPPLRLRLTRENGVTVVSIDGRPVELEALNNVLAGEGAVILDASDEVPVGDVIFAYDACVTAGRSPINFAA